MMSKSNFEKGGKVMKAFLIFAVVALVLSFILVFIREHFYQRQIRFFNRNAVALMFGLGLLTSGIIHNQDQAISPFLGLALIMWAGINFLRNRRF
jgi:hypothetical protein